MDARLCPQLGWRLRMNAALGGAENFSPPPTSFRPRGRRSFRYQRLPGRNRQRFISWKRSKERDGGGVYEGGDGSGNEMNSTKEKKRRSQAGFEPTSERIRRRDTEHGGIYEKKKERIEYSTLTGRVAFST